MPKKSEGKYTTKKAKKIKEKQIQVFDYDKETGTKKENQEKEKKQKEFQKQKIKEKQKAKRKEKKEKTELEIEIKNQNQKQIQGKKKKRKLKILLFLILIIGIIAFLKSSFFTLTKIDVIQNNKVSKEEIIKLSKLETNKNMFQKELFLIKNNLKKNLYIDNVKIKIKSSSEIQLIIKERVEKYYIEKDGKYYIIEEYGKIIKETQEIPKDLIKISVYKTKPEDIIVGNNLSTEDLNDIQEINNIITNYIAKTNIDKEIVEAYFENKMGYVLSFKNEKKKVYFGDANKIETKILYLKKIIEQEKNVEGEIFLNKDFKDKFPVFREKV